MKYTDFYRANGIRKIADVNKVHAVADVDLPRGMALHSLDFFSTETCVLSIHDDLIKESKKPVYVINVDESTSYMGSPKYLKARIPFYKKCVKKFDEYKRITKEKSSVVPATRVLLYSYLPIANAYKYKKDKYAISYRAQNIIQTLIDNINDETNRTNILYFNKLTNVPTPGTIRTLLNKNTKDRAKFIKDPESFTFLHLVLYAQGKESIFDQVKRPLTLIVKYGSNVKVIELSRLKDKDTNKQGINPGTDVASYKLIHDLMVSSEVVLEENDDTVDLTQEEKIEIAAAEIDIETPKVGTKTTEESMLEVLDEKAETLGFDTQKKSNLKKKIKNNKVKDPDTGVDIKELKRGDVKITEDKSLDNHVILDKSMLNSSLKEFTSRYVNDFLYSDISRMVYKIQDYGLLITRFEKETHGTVTGDYIEYTLATSYLGGTRSTIRWRIPLIKEDGTFRFNNTEYTLRTQRSETVLAKIKADSVIMNTYAGKLTVSRSALMTHNPEASIKKVFISEALDNGLVLNYDEVFDPFVTVPRIYSIMGKFSSGIEHNGIKLNFDYSKREELLKKGDDIKTVEKKGLLVGRKGNEYVLLNENSDFFIKNENQGNIYELLAIEGVRDINDLFVRDMAVISLLGKKVPVGFVLAYMLGLPGLIKYLGLKMTVIGRLARVTSGMKIRFKDVSLHIEGATVRDKLILSAFTNNTKMISTYDLKDFKTKEVYYNIFVDLNIYTMIMDVIDMHKVLYIDPISEGHLKELGLPQDYINLMIEAVGRITDDRLPNPNIKEEYKDNERFKGYERIPGTIYTLLIESIRDMVSRPNVTRKKLEMSPYAIWQRIMSDPAVDAVKALNPLQELKEREVVTLTGNGGRSKDSITEADIIYKETDLGTISEATPDSGDVGITSYMAPGAKLTSLDGSSESIKDSKESPASTLSSSTLNAPFAAEDDVKRAVMISVQAAHGVAVKGNELPYVRTGFDVVIPSLLSDKFAVQAKGPGTITKVTADGITVSYNDKTKESHKLGSIILKSGGKTFENTLVTDLKKGDKVKKGDMIAYNDGFFLDDPISGKKVYQNRVYGLCALIEDHTVYEDGSAISSNLASKLETSIVKPKLFTYEGDKAIVGLVKEGDKVKAGDPLLTVYTSADDSTILSDDDIKALRDIGAAVLKADVSGTIGEVEVFYHGVKSDMSNSTKNVINARNDVLERKAKAAGTTVYDCEVQEDFSVKGRPLELGNVHIKISIVYDNVHGAGDKLVVANQLKSVVTEVYESGTIQTTSGEDVDMKFSLKSMNARLVAALKFTVLNRIVQKLPDHALELLNK